MKIIDVWIAKNGEHWGDGTPYISDGYASIYILTPVPRDYFAGSSVERIARIRPDVIQEGRESIR